jgi:hypothetical protein
VTAENLKETNYRKAFKRSLVLTNRKVFIGRIYVNESIGKPSTK